MPDNKDWRNYEKRRASALGSDGNNPGRRGSRDNHQSPPAYKAGVGFDPYTGQPIIPGPGHPPPYTPPVAGPSEYNVHGDYGPPGFAIPRPGQQQIQQPQRGTAYDNYAYEGPSPSHGPQNPRFRHSQDNSQITPAPYPNQDYDDDDEEDGPMQKKRKCRDVICFGFLSASIVLMVAIAVYSISKGSIDRIIHMTDSFNCDLCGVQNKEIRGIPNSGLDRTEFPYVMFLKRDGAYDKTFHYFLPDESLKFVTQCRSACPIEYKAIANRCIAKEVPLQSSKQLGVIDDVSTFFAEVAADFERSWIQVLWMCGVALVLSVIMSILLRVFAGIIIWIVVLGVSLCFIAGSIYLWLLWRVKKSDYDKGVEGALSQIQVTGILIAAIVVSVVTVLLLLVFLFMRKRIALLTKLFNEAGKAIHAMPLLLLQPLLTFGALGVALGSWVVILLLIESAGDPTLVTVDVPNTESVCVYKKNDFLLFSRWWNLFMVGWITQFIVGCQHLIIAGAVAKWFFTRNKNRLGFPILLSAQRLLRFHLGSVAFGSLIIAIVKLIRYILNTIQNRLGGDNAFCKGILCCCKCCIWCLENFLIFLNRNAYIEVAIHGYGFCKSARKAFKVLVDNALRVAAINSLGDFVLFLSKLAIVAVTVLIGYYLTKDKSDLNHIWVPLTIGGICAYFIAHCFISVYEMAIDTVFICFCEDCDMNDGQSKPYYMSKGLMEFVKNSNKALKTRKERKQERSGNARQ